MTDPDDHKLTITGGIFFFASLAAFIWSIIEMIAVVVYLCQGEFGQVLQEGLFAFLAAGLGLGAGLIFCHLDDKANPVPEPTMWDRLDEIVGLASHQAVLDHLPKHIARQFTAAGQPCPQAKHWAPEIHKWQRKTEAVPGASGHNMIKSYVAHVCDCGAMTTEQEWADSQRWLWDEGLREADEKRKAEIKKREAARKVDRTTYADGGPVVEVMQFGSDKPVRTYTPEARMTMADLQAELDKLSIQVDRARMYR